MIKSHVGDLETWRQIYLMVIMGQVLLIHNCWNGHGWQLKCLFFCFRIEIFDPPLMFVIKSCFGHWRRRSGTTGIQHRSKRNKVIRPKSRASALSKTARQTDRQTIFFSKRHFKQLFTTPSFFSTIQRHEKCDKKTLKRPWDGMTDRQTDRRTDRKVAYRVA